MASNAIYKSKVREGTSVATRRKSRGLERKLCREDEVNKRRFLSDDMSPVVEDNSYFDDEEENPKKPAVHKKAPSRLERLQQWRDEKKRKLEKEKKDSKKLMFKIAPVKYSGDAHLYWMPESKEIKPTKKDAAGVQAKPATAGTAPSLVSAQMSVPSGVALNTRQTRATKSAQPQATKPAQPQPTRERPARSTRQTAATKPSLAVNPPNVQAIGQPRGKISDLASKLTASAAAKVKNNLDKPKEFLRAKTRSTKVTMNSTRDKESSKNQNKKTTTQQVVLTDLPEETNLNHSGLGVSSPRHSTPAPRSSARVKRGSERKSKLEFEDSRARSSQRNRNVADFFTESAEEGQITSDNEDPAEKEVFSSPAEGSPKSNKAEEMKQQSFQRLSLNLMSRSKLRKSQRLSVVDRVGVANGLPTPSMGESSVASQSRKHKQQLFASNNNGAEVLMGDSLTPFTPKRHRRSVNVSSPLDVGLVPNLEHEDIEDTQLPIFECSKPSFKEVKMPSAVSKRRSVRIAGFVPPSDANFDDENTPQKAQYPRTPRFILRKSTRISLAHHESPVSTFVSVSDEGTSEIIGESVVDEMTLPATPRYAHHLTVSGRSTRRSLRKSFVRSEVIDVSGEGTSLSNDLDPGTVYQIGEPEATSGVLQELTVKKFDGEVSFIEVSVDENAEGNISVEQTASTEDLAVTVFDTQVSADGNAAVSEEDSQSTPRVPINVALSSTENNCPHSPSTSNTPRSSRSRGLTMSGFSSFKTPGEPVSAALTKSQRKRRKTVPIKSPEQMIEILKKSPMVEMSRRRSRHVSSPGVMNPTNLGALLAAEVINVQDATAVLPQAQTIEQVQENGGVRYYRELLVSQTNRLNQLCNQWNELTSLTVNLSEEVQGQIRAAVGKAQLLMDQRFKQFSGLVDDCEFKRGEKETTLTDLQGFWEMIYFQVENVNHLFDNLTELQQKNWETKQPSPTQNMPKRKAVKINKPKVKSNFSAFREEVLRRKGQSAVVQSSAVPVNKVDSGITKTFDAGYFQVKSPVRSSPAEKSNDSSPLMPAASDAGHSNSTSQVNVSQVAEKPASSSDEQQSSTPVSQGNKENTVSHIRFSAMSAKRLSYLPVVPSPLLNDITGIRPKK